MSKESTVRLSYLGEFLRTGYNSSVENEQRMKDTAAKYAELREEILKKYADDENERFKQLSELNQAFEASLKNENKLPLFPHNVNKLEAYMTNDEDVQKDIEKEIKRKEEETEKYNQALKEIYDNFNKNMSGHVDMFYESFIKNLETMDFETAYAESMDLLNNSESKSAEDISYSDMVLIRDTMMSKDEVLDEDGKPVEHKYNTLEEALRAMTSNEKITETIRQDIIDRLKSLNLQV
jgi:hypothetical protein